MPVLPVPVQLLALHHAGKVTVDVTWKKNRKKRSLLVLQLCICGCKDNRQSSILNFQFLHWKKLLLQIFHYRNASDRGLFPARRDASWSGESRKGFKRHETKWTFSTCPGAQQLPAPGWVWDGCSDSPGGEGGESEPIQEPMPKKWPSHSGGTGWVTGSALQRSILPAGRAEPRSKLQEPSHSTFNPVVLGLSPALSEDVSQQEQLRPSHVKSCWDRLFLKLKRNP